MICRIWTGRVRWFLLRPCVASLAPASDSWRLCGPSPRASSIVLDCPAELGPLDRAAATSLLKQRFPALAPRVRERLIAEAQGNPLALLELPIALRDARPARRHLADALPLTARLQALFASRITALPAPTIALLLIAVLDGTGDLRVLEAAAPAESGLDHLAAAERAGIIQVDEPVRD